jgi:hypothetical protein
MLEAVALLEAGHPGPAAERAEHAANAFAAQSRDGWQAAAETVLLSLRHRAGDPVDEDQLKANADRLQALGQRNDSLEAELLMVEVLADRGRLEDAQAQLGRSRQAIDRSTMDLRLAGAATEAVLLERCGRTAEAMEVAERGFELLATQQALIGSSDLRVGLRQHGDRLSQFGIRTALAAAEPLPVLRWLERNDLATNTLRPVRPPEDPQMRQALGRLRALSDEQVEEKRALEETIRTRDRAHPGSSSPTGPADIEWLADQLGDAVGLTYGADGDRLFACVVADGSPTIQFLGSVDDVLRVTRSARAALRRRASVGPSPDRRSAARSTARTSATLDRLDEMLLRPLDIGDRPLVLSPTPHLFAVPWNALTSRVGRSTVVTSSLTHWANTEVADPTGASVLIAGPELHHAEQEVLAVESSATSPVLLTGSDATAPRALRAIDGAAVAHIVAHGTVRADNPLFSSLQLVDGKLNVYELSDLAHPPAVVVLSACHVGLPADQPGRELLGMTTGLFNAATSCVVASSLPVADNATTVEIMSRFHRLISDGLGPAAAWAAVQRSCPDDEQVLDAASFVVFGRG